MTYKEQIKHPKWQKKRLEVLHHHGFKCQKCKASDQELHVHHTQYFSNRFAWEYDLDELQCLCHSCHQKAHDLTPKRKTDNSDIDWDRVERQSRTSGIHFDTLESADNDSPEISAEKFRRRMLMERD